MYPEDEGWNEKFKMKFVECLSDRSKIFNKFQIKLEQEFIFFNAFLYCKKPSPYFQQILDTFLNKINQTNTSNV